MKGGPGGGTGGGAADSKPSGLMGSAGGGDASSRSGGAAARSDASGQRAGSSSRAGSGGGARAGTGDADDLKRIRGVGPLNERKLNDAGITRFAQVAAWTAEDQRRIGEQLSFGGRIEREDWVGQARVLAEGGETDFSKRVDRGAVRTSLRSSGSRRRDG